MQLNYPKLERLSLNKVFEGEATHFNPACAEMIDRIVGPVVGEEVIDVSREVNCEGSRLDLLAVTNDHRVAVELQFGSADASHLGRLIGWYAPAVEATVSILVAEGFPKLLVNQVRDKKINSLALVRVFAGWNQDGQVGIDFEVVASSSVVMRGESSELSEDVQRKIKSTETLATALDKHGLKDSNAKRYVRLFPVKNHCWASIRIRAGRVVLNVGSSANVRPELLTNELGEDWRIIGKGIWRTVSDEVESYVINENEFEKIAKYIDDLKPEIQSVVDLLIGTIPEDEEVLGAV
tara:strand:- start:1706 stop:2587 length:882 start_codon:yes stop_codon:yes gene_type:complete